MKLYVSSIGIPTPNDLAQLVEKPLKDVSVAVIPNAQDYYSERARAYQNEAFSKILRTLGMKAETVDLRGYGKKEKLLEKLKAFDLIWARGGNTFCLRYEMRRSGFEHSIRELLEMGIVYGGDSAGALVAGVSIAGIESADIPDFAEQIITEGLGLVPYVILPHVDNPDFTEAVEAVHGLHDADEVISLNDNQAVIFKDSEHWIVGT